MTEMCFYETASCITTSVVSGASGFEFGGIAKASQVDYFTPMEPLLASKVGHAVAGMTRKEANEILKVLLPRYESKLEDPPLGKKFGECWDIHRKKPSEEYVSLYNNVRKELSDLGIRF
jgi:methylamine--corrinoid protein Co-methyltransferase